MPHFHLPVQSGSDAVLARMRRDYTVAAYLERFDRLRAARPGIAVTTDFIVGFPGETDAGLRGLAAAPRARPLRPELQLRLQPAARTPVAALRLGSAPEWQEVPREVAVERLERLLTVQRRIAAEILAGERGSAVEVLVEGPSDGPGERLGRTPENRVVHLAAPEGAAPAGALVQVRDHAGRDELALRNPGLEGLPLIRARARARARARGETGLVHGLGMG